MFVSVQGEGLHVGERQLFFRTSGCAATCYWCDTVPSKSERSKCAIIGESKRWLPNPLSVDQAVEEAVALIEESNVVHSVSITGGEPLEQGEFVGEVAKEFRRRGLRIHVETNGLEIDGLRSVRQFADIVAMDIKLPHATGEEHWDTHREFLKYLTCRQVFVKIVVDVTTPRGEIERAVELVAGFDKNTPLVLQPESRTFFKGGPQRDALIELILDAQRKALRRLGDVRVIPQCHKLLKVR
jgi:organic radical activating enzyme